jgi:hypothetical protein
MKMLDPELLNLAALQGCSVPGCNHKSHREIFLHPRCHSGAGLRLSYPQPDVLQLDCAACSDQILNIAVAEEAPMRPLCHPNAPVWVSYKHGTGKLKVICRKCRKPVTTIRVSKSSAGESIQP